MLMFGWEFPPHISGGLGTACYGLSKGLLHNEVEVLFVVPKIYGDEESDAIRLINASDISIEATEHPYHQIWKKLTIIGIHSLLRPYLSPEQFSRAAKFSRLERSDIEASVFSQRFQFTGKYGENLFTEVARYAVVAAKIASRYDFDVIHAHDWLTYPAAIAAREVSGKPFIAHVHATEFDRSGENINRDVYEMERQGMHAADRIIAVSNFTRNIIIVRYGVPPEKVIAVHNAVMPAEHLNEKQERVFREKLVTFLGRVTFQKGPDYFVEAAYKVLQKDDNVRFVMAGTGDMLPKIIKRVAQLRMASKFHFTGFLKGWEVDKIFGLSDVYVMPSVSEPFGISPLEALRSSVPVIISKQSGVAEILRHALKVDFWDIDAIADRIYALLHYQGISKMFIKYGKAEVENLKWDDAAGKVKRVYEEVLSNLA
ncbi:MAG TPA: glycosyltransferase family 4 protein [Chitinophagales bacterium]|nr:glycosyltransferase family 4 protein [Chitinophagales bacterium]